MAQGSDDACAPRRRRRTAHHADVAAPLFAIPTPRPSHGEAQQALLSALDTSDIPTIRKAMAGYADSVQGVQLQSAAFELLNRVENAKKEELATLISEMRILATRSTEIA